MSTLCMWNLLSRGSAAIDARGLASFPLRKTDEILGLRALTWPDHYDNRWLFTHFASVRTTVPEILKMHADESMNDIRDPILSRRGKGAWCEWVCVQTGRCAWKQQIDSQTSFTRTSVIPLTFLTIRKPRKRFRILTFHGDAVDAAGEKNTQTFADIIEGLLENPVPAPSNPSTEDAAKLWLR